MEEAQDPHQTNPDCYSQNYERRRVSPCSCCETHGPDMKALRNETHGRLAD